MITAVLSEMQHLRLTARQAALRSALQSEALQSEGKYTDSAVQRCSLKASILILQFSAAITAAHARMEQLKHLGAISISCISKICEVTSYQTLVCSCLCTRLAETTKTVVCHLKVLVPCQRKDTPLQLLKYSDIFSGLDLRGDQFSDIGSLLLVYEIGRD
ncbi:hypothetical protein DPMN_105844 [Dreissena polymorpha]|uniref:Uncharacterized protein n=1 Tax=Dreissena polymorpha TaxID=45954 RepID=A0A9D4K3X0_DREPO|nr:hypothetical protein DPMN_105844 [Dreissena polymorpha]